MNRRSSQKRGPIFANVIPIIRLVGFAMVVSGVFIMLGEVEILTFEVGLFVTAFGLIEMLAVPAILDRAQNRKKDDFLTGVRPYDRPDHRG